MGREGLVGSPGPIGFKGNTGEPGPQGLSGPRGVPGVPVNIQYTKYHISIYFHIPLNLLINRDFQGTQDYKDFQD